MRLAERLRIEPDGTVVALSGKVEYGQGIRTGFALLVADELAVPLARVRVVLGDTAETPWDMGTFGSLSTKLDGAALRRAAAFARGLLLARAAARFGVPVERLRARDGAVECDDGRRADYAALAAEAPLDGDVPDDVAVKSGDARPLAHAPWQRLEARDIVTGRAQYVADLRLPGLLRAMTLHAPSAGARLVALDDAAARALPGVVAVVRDGDCAGVVADTAEVARAALMRLHATWEAREPTSVRHDLVLRDDGDVDTALAAGRRLDAEYSLPHVANAPIGPSAAVADVRADAATVWAATQRPFGLRDELAALLGVPAARVRVIAQLASGSYGRNNVADAAVEAARLSRAVGRPVLVQWSRAQELQASTNRPYLLARAAAALDGDGKLAAWKYDERTNLHTYSAGDAPDPVLRVTAGRLAVPPYRIGKARVELHIEPGLVRVGALRSLAGGPNAFAVESFVDELAHLAGADPLAFRLRHLDDARLGRVLEAACARAGWATRPRGQGRGLGLACAEYHGTRIAEVADVEVDDGGRVRVRRVVCAVDPGDVVNEGGARNQLEGGIVQGASVALLEELRVADDGRVLAQGWRDYPIATFRDAPDELDVFFVPTAGAPSTGVGEPGLVPVAAALANAIFAATGARVRDLPLRPDRVQAAR